MAFLLSFRSDRHQPTLEGPLTLFIINYCKYHSIPNISPELMDFLKLIAGLYIPGVHIYRRGLIF